MGNVKTIIMCKEPKKDGTFRYFRIPWEMVQYEDTLGISPMPLGESFGSRAVDAAYVVPLDDMLFDESDHALDNEIEEILWFDSEKEFLAKFEFVTGQYVGDSNQSAEFGWPRSN